MHGDWAYVVAPSETLRTALSERVARSMGKALEPEEGLFARELPKAEAR